MRLTLLGTGSTSAPPLYGCHCEVCETARQNLARARKPASAIVEAGNTCLLIDAGLHDLAERYPLGSYSAFLLTHFHPDHVQGLFSLRWGVGDKIPAYCPHDKEGCADLLKNPGLLDFRSVNKFESFSIGDINITPVPLIHSKVTLGYCLQHGESRIAYLTDTAGLPPNTVTFLRKWQPTELIVDCSYPPRAQAPKNHNDITLALETIATVLPQRAWLTHIGHELDAWLNCNAGLLPLNVKFAHDGMVIGK